MTVVDEVVGEVEVVVLEVVGQDGVWLVVGGRDEGQFALALLAPLEPLLELQVLQGVGGFDLLVEGHQRCLLAALHLLL